MIRPSCRLFTRARSVAPLSLRRCRHNTRYYHASTISRRWHEDGSGTQSLWAEPAILTHASESTIFALSTAQGKAGIAVIRVSGQDALTIYQNLCPGAKSLKPRYAAVRTIYEPHAEPIPGSTLDSNAIVLFFPGSASVTGEDVLELHVHGGPAIVKSVLAAIPRCGSGGSIRYAEAGEFTRRAFMNDRMDLVQVEALGDSLSALTEKQRRIAVRGTTSKLGQVYEQWRQMLLEARGELEALIDFSEDQHFDESPEELMSSVAGQVTTLRTTLLAHIQNAIRGELLRNGISISLLGAPNAGKSSLLNRIVGREAAIVSPEAGTTRDIVEVSLDIGGFLCRFGDTAGLRAQPAGAIEAEGVRRAQALAASSDLVLAVLPLSPSGLDLDPDVVATVTKLHATGIRVHAVVTKTDLAHDPLLPADQVRRAIPGIGVSLVTCRPQPAAPDGVAALMAALTAECASLTASETSGGDQDQLDGLGATARQRALLDECVAHLDRFLAVGGDLVLGAEHLRAAAGCLARITGRGEVGDVEEVLGVVFERFCVGK